MKGIDTQGHFEDIFSDEKLKINNETLNNVCKINQGSKTCKYIMMNKNGFFCVKNTKIKSMIDLTNRKKQMVASSDNCSGL